MLKTEWPVENTIHNVWSINIIVLGYAKLTVATGLHPPNNTDADMTCFLTPEDFYTSVPCKSTAGVLLN